MASRENRSPQAAVPTLRGGVNAQERRLQVTFLNRKELPVTVGHMQVAFYKGAGPSRGGHGRTWSSWTISTVEAHCIGPGGPPAGRVRRVHDSPDPRSRRQAGAMEGVDRAEFVANIVGVRAVLKVLPGPWHLLPSCN